MIEALILATALHGPARCNVYYDATATGAGAYADLETNTCNDTIQVRDLCYVIITGQTYEVYSGETQRLETTVRATCPLPDIAILGQIQYPDGGPWRNI